MTVTATSPAMARSKLKTRSNSGASHGSQRRLVEPLYFGVDVARALIAKAASSVMSLPLSRLWIVMRETPRSLATSVGVPMASLIALYSVAVISRGLVVVAITCRNQFASEFGIREREFEKISINAVNVSADNLSFVGDMGNIFARFDLLFLSVVVFHFRCWLGVGRSQWRRGERKIFLRLTQELSVKSFYAPFLRLNEPADLPPKGRPDFNKDVPGG